MCSPRVCRRRCRQARRKQFQRRRRSSSTAAGDTRQVGGEARSQQGLLQRSGVCCRGAAEDQSSVHPRTHAFAHARAIQPLRGARVGEQVPPRRGLCRRHTAGLQCHRRIASQSLWVGSGETLLVKYIGGQRSGRRGAAQRRAAQRRAAAATARQPSPLGLTRPSLPSLPQWSPDSDAGSRRARRTARAARELSAAASRR